ncbi:MAG: MBL fold metallo-hydrolase, partial [Acidimicrobiia bacterium]|nr:MBL fold metallo-hydrolase [Acidimicrobiia bacterium]
MALSTMEIHRADGLLVLSLVAGPLENNVWVVACTASGTAVVIDAADEPRRILEAVAPFRVEAVLTTHSHPDHLAAANAVCKALDVPFRIHPLDAIAAGIHPFDPIGHDEQIEIGEVALRA